MFCGMSVKEAVFWLLDFAGYRRIENPVKPVSYTHLDVYKRQAEQVIKQPFQLIKVSDNGDDTEVGLLAGAEFTAYLLSLIHI